MSPARDPQVLSDPVRANRTHDPLADRCRMGIRGACGHIEPRVPGEVRRENSWVPGRPYPLPVRSKQPNAWGLYDLASGWWELVADQWRYNPRDAEVDPLYLRTKDESSREHTHRSHGLLTGRYSFGTIENIPASGKCYVGTKFRIVVEVQPTTAAGPSSTATEH